MVLVKAGIQDKAAAEIVAVSVFVEESMATNENFPDPAPKISDVATAREALEASISAAMHGDRVAVAKRNADAKHLGDLLVGLCRYVNSVSMGNQTIANTSGFPAAKSPEPIPLVAPPYNVTALPTSKDGEALVRFRSHRGTKSKQVYASSGDPNDQASFQLIGITTKARFLATGLDPEKTYWFRITATCAAGVSGYSDPAKCRANAA
jgi:hypothetical protein